MKKLIGTMFVMLALTGCAVDAYDPNTPDVGAGAVATAKADGAFGATELELGQLATGNAAGEAFSLYAIQLGETDRVRISVTRTSGDLRPSAYLYRGTEIFLPPSDYETGDGTVTLNYEIADGGEHHIVVKAYQGEGAGEFELATECLGGACAGISANPIQRQSNCIETAAQCAIRALPRYNGRVGAVTAQRVFDNCIAEQPAEACEDACAGDGAAVCDEIVSHLPGLADQPAACHDVLTQCLDQCDEIGGFYSADTIEDASASACWTGYNGNCVELMQGHSACGGTEYDAGTVDACEAMCAATEGAWDEGPWDGCMDECVALGRVHDDFIRGVAREAGEYVSIDGSDAFGYVAYAELADEVRSAVEWRIRRFDDEAAREMRTDTAHVSEENVFTITRDGQVVGYMVGLEYYIDHPLFDGGGMNLYLNLEGEVVVDEEWWG